jgi:hypothetical protein
MHQTIRGIKNCQEVYICGRQNAENADFQSTNATRDRINFQ